MVSSIINRSSFHLCILLVMTLAIVSTASATIITLSLDENIQTSEIGTAPGTSTPWATATFDDGDSAGSVTLTLSALNLTPGEYTEDIRLWLFNVDPTIDLDSISYSIISVDGDAPTLDVGDGVPDRMKLDGNDASFDMGFEWDPGSAADDSPEARFGDDDIMIMELYAPGLLASSFFFESTIGSSGDSYYTALLMKSFLPDQLGQYSVIGDSAAPVPEPLTIFLVGIGLSGIVPYQFRKRKKTD